MNERFNAQVITHPSVLSKTTPTERFLADKTRIDMTPVDVHELSPKHKFLNELFAYQEEEPTPVEKMDTDQWIAYLRSHYDDPEPPLSVRNRLRVGKRPAAKVLYEEQFDASLLSPFMWVALFLERLDLLLDKWLGRTYNV